MIFDPFSIPRFAEAVFRERFVRDAAFLGVTENVAGYELRPMTLRDYLILQTAQNPLLHQALPSPTQLASFLWLLSADYDPAATRRRRQFLRRCRAFCPPSVPLWPTKRASVRWYGQRCRALECFRATVAAAKEYVADTFQDRPAAKASPGFTPSYYSDAIYWCALLGREYGYTLDAVLGMNLKVLFGFVAEITEHHKVKEPACNPSDRIRADWLAEQNQVNRSN